MPPPLHHPLGTHAARWLREHGDGYDLHPATSPERIAERQRRVVAAYLRRHPGATVERLVKELGRVMR